MFLNKALKILKDQTTQKHCIKENKKKIFEQNNVKTCIQAQNFEITLCKAKEKIPNFIKYTYHLSSQEISENVTYNLPRFFQYK